MFAKPFLSTEWGAFETGSTEIVEVANTATLAVSSSDLGSKNVFYYSDDDRIDPTIEFELLGWVVNPSGDRVVLVLGRHFWGLDDVDMDLQLVGVHLTYGYK